MRKLGHSRLILLSFMILLFEGCSGGGGSPIEKNLDTSSEQNAHTLEDLGTNREPIKKQKVFYIVKKLEVTADENITTNYLYKDNYLSRINRSSTDGWTDTKSYKYFKDHKVMKTYDARDELESVSVFEEVNSPKNMNIYNRRLSFNKNVKYIFFTNDSLTHLKPYRIEKFITTKGTGNIYRYNNKDLLTKIENGSFEDNSEVDQLDNDKNISYLLSPLKFESNQEIIYSYDKNNILTGITFEGQGGKLEADANVTLYSSGILKELSLSTGDKFIYNSKGYLTTKSTVKNGVSSTLNYKYSNDFKTVTVRDDSGKIAQQYTFSELK